MMLTCNAEIDALNRYAPPGIGSLCSKSSFSSIFRVRYPKCMVKSNIGGSGGKEHLIGGGYLLTESSCIGQGS